MSKAICKVTFTWEQDLDSEEIEGEDDLEKVDFLQDAIDDDPWGWLDDSSPDTDVEVNLKE